MALCRRSMVLHTMLMIETVRAYQNAFLATPRCVVPLAAARALGRMAPHLYAAPRTFDARSARLVAVAETASKTVVLPTGIDMEYRESGTGSEKPALVFIHGSFHSSWCWAEAWMPFFEKRGYHCFAMSLRGTAATPQTGDATSVQLSEHIDDITAFVDKVVPTSKRAPILIGHSFGGMYAQKICEADELQVGALVLLCSVSPKGSTGTVMRYIFQKPKLAWEIVRAFVFKEAATNLEICRRVFFSETEPPDAKVVEFMRFFAADSQVGLDTRTAPQEFPGKTSCADDGRCSWLHRRPPTLVVGAESDLVVDQKAVAETAEFYDAELLWVRGPHDLMLVHDDTAAKSIVKWIEAL